MVDSDGRWRQTRQTRLFSEKRQRDRLGVRGEKRGRVSCDSSSGQLDLLTRVTHATLFFLARHQKTASPTFPRPSRIVFVNTLGENLCVCVTSCHDWRWNVIFFFIYFFLSSFRRNSRWDLCICIYGNFSLNFLFFFKYISYRKENTYEKIIGFVIRIY